MAVYNTALSRVTTSGTVAAGSKTIVFANTGAADATVLGTVLEAGESIKFEAPSTGTVTAIAYVATGTELTITTLTAA